jgi:GH24 family phage-related lysozyme (muramidase)
MFLAVNPMDGMDDQDIKDALEAMDRRNAARQREEWQIPRYKPVDPGLQARILRMFGQPYDKSAIDPKEAYYLNGGWDDGDEGDGGTKPQSRPLPQRPAEQSPAEPFDPWKNVWKLDWGPEGSPADKPQTPQPLPGGYAGPGIFPNNNGIVNALARPSGFLAATPLGLAKPGLENAKPGDLVFGRDGVIRRAADENALSRAVDRLTARVLEPRPEQGGASLPGYGSVKNALGNGPGGTNSATGFQPMSSNTERKSYRPDPNLQVPGPKPPDIKFPNPLGERQKTHQYMIPSDKVIDLIGQIEGFSDVPYQVHDDDPPTIGFGHVILPGEDFSRGITRKEAIALKKKDIKERVDEVNEWARLHNVKLTQQQFDALVSFHYNTGSIFEMKKLRDLIKSGKATPDEIRAAFGEYYYSRGRRMFGLWKRRMDEADMYLNGAYEQKMREMPKDIEFDNI